MLAPSKAKAVRRVSGITSGVRVRRGAVRWRTLLLASIPVLDPVINQVNTVYQPSLGPVSMLQAARSGLLLAVIAVAVMSRPGPPRVSRAVRKIVLAACVCTWLFAAKDCVADGSAALGTLVGYGQIGYWLAMWYVGTAWIRDGASARTVATGLVISTLITAASVYYGWVVGVRTTYEQQGVMSSAGFFVSAKGIAGSLVAGAMLCAYVGHRRHAWSSTIAALLCLGASFLTYARAGMVALAASLAWLAIWGNGMRSGVRSSWTRRLILGVLCGAVVLVSTLGTADLERRWSDLEDPHKAGSGRLLIWGTALDSFLHGSFAEQLFGRGFLGMFELIYNSLGIRLHTHNDVLDMLVIGGLFGVLFLGLVLAGIIVQIRSARPRSPEFALAVAVLIVLLVQGFLTGQMFLPDIMTFYLLGITAALGLAATTNAVIVPECDRRHLQRRSFSRRGV